MYDWQVWVDPIRRGYLQKFYEWELIKLAGGLLERLCLPKSKNWWWKELGFWVHQGYWVGSSSPSSIHFYNSIQSYSYVHFGLKDKINETPKITILLKIQPPFHLNQPFLPPPYGQHRLWENQIIVYQSYIGGHRKHWWTKSEGLPSERWRWGWCSTSAHVDEEDRRRELQP